MRLITLTSAILTLLSTTVLADTLPTPTPTTPSDNYRAEITPFPELIEDASHLEIRQNLGVVPDAQQQVGQVPPVTVYTIATQVGATGVQTVYTYTQLFSSVPDQWPAPKAGVIGYGSDHAKRAVEARDTGIAEMDRPVLEVEQPVVMVQELEIVTIPVQEVLEVVIVKGLVVSNVTSINNGTRPTEARNGSAEVSLVTAAIGPLHTAAAAASGVIKASGLGG